MPQNYLVHIVETGVMYGETKMQKLKRSVLINATTTHQNCYKITHGQVQYTKREGTKDTVLFHSATISRLKTSNSPTLLLPTSAQTPVS